MRPRPAPFTDLNQHLGRKVSLRYRLHGDPEHPFSEAVGFVASVKSSQGDEVLTIMNRRGETVAVPAPDLLALKVLPA